jgi:polyisoprenyl-teichoic acid--peptidoglycan teichoic acid transferase
LHRREDQYRSIEEQMLSSRRERRRATYRKRRWLAVLTVIAGVLIASALQTGASLPTLLPTNADLARGGSSDGGSSEPRDLLEGTEGPTVLSAERSASQAEPGEPAKETRDEPTSGPDGTEDAKASEKPKDPPPASEEPLNVLILGVDRRPSEGESASSRSDTMMLAQVTPGTGRVELLSVPRDLLVEIEPGVEDRINTAYAYGGVEQAKAVMEGVTGVPIDAHAIIDFEGFEQTIDAVGGVNVDVGGGEQFPEKWDMGYGTTHLNGRKALMYARYRGTAGGDLDRIERQQKLLAALRAEMLGWNTVTQLPSMLRIANGNVDTDLGLMQAISLGRALVLRGDDGDLESMQLKGYPTTLPSGAQVLVPDWEANEEILQDFRE